MTWRAVLFALILLAAVLSAPSWGGALWWLVEAQAEWVRSWPWPKVFADD